MQFEPIFNLDCVECDNEPVVGIREDEDSPLRCTQLCGLHFFGSRLMIDWELWNLEPDSTE